MSKITLSLKSALPATTRFAISIALLGLFLTQGAWAQDSTETMEPPMKKPMKKETAAQQKTAQQDIVSTLKAKGNFTVLIGALEKAGLAPELQKKKAGKTYTLFAPTDAAFDDLPAGTLDSLSSRQLASVLQFHLVGRKATAAKAKKKGALTSAQGGMLTVEGDETGATVNGATIVETDLQASNGIIHVIDTVLMPENMKAGTTVGSKSEEETPRR